MRLQLVQRVNTISRYYLAKNYLKVNLYLKYITYYGFHILSHISEIVGPTIKKPRRTRKRKLDVDPDNPDKYKVVDYVYKITETYSKYDDLCDQPLYDEFECDLCHAQFRGRPEQQAHMRSVHKISVVPSKIYNCTFCSKTFTKSYNLKKHEEIHQRSYDCSECEAKFRNKKKMSVHLKTEHGIETNELICDLCGKGYKYHRDLNMHLAKHTGIKEHQCGKCEKSFFTIKSLKEHEKIHNPTIYECAICSAHLRSKKTLKIHMRAHLGIKNHQCLLCDKSFMTNCRLVEHTKSHTNEKPYKCTQCDCAYVSRGKLRAHSITHTTSDKFYCEFCSKEFNFYNSYEKHKRHQHLETTNTVVVAELAE